MPGKRDEPTAADARRKLTVYLPTSLYERRQSIASLRHESINKYVVQVLRDVS